MRGYLVTITSRDEDWLLDAITTQAAWSGGARFRGINDASSVPHWYNNSLPAPGVFANQNVSGNSGAAEDRTFRWQSGPETNIEYTMQGFGALHGAYTNWNHGEPTPFVSGYRATRAVCRYTTVPNGTT